MIDFRSSRFRWTVFAFAAVLLASSMRADEQSLPAVFGDAAPRGGAELRELEQVTRNLAERAAACTVGVQSGMAMGSGVIVSEDGYVLTAAHVAGRPGRDVRIILPDGTDLEGKSLGVHTQADGALIKITSEGTWPFAAMVSSETAPQVGDWCLATGHPGGFDRRRGTPVRLGRIIEIYDTVMRTDCAVTEGDSGGPLFDMHGRVIGIHSRISEDVTDNFHGPVLAFQEWWDELKEGKVAPIRPASQFLDLLDVNRDGNISRSELPDGTKRRIFDRLAEQFSLNPQEPHSIDELAADALGWQKYALLDFDGAGSSDEVTEALRRRYYVRGREVLRSFAGVTREVGQSIVEIRSHGDSVALGAVVSADGLVLTKASELGDDIVCRLADGRNVPAQRAEVDDTNDLALLRIDADNLHPIKWTKTPLHSGSWLVTPGVDGRIETAGVISTPIRKIARTPAVMGVAIEERSEPPRVRQVIRDGGAFEAGVQNGDVIAGIAGKNIRTFEELKDALQEFRAGDVVEVTVERGRELLEFDILLAAQEEVFFRFGIRRLNGPLSRRRDDFPQVIQHDSALSPTACGGPAVDSSGRAIGLNIARADRISAYLIPYAAFADFLERHVPSRTAISVNQ